MNKRVLVFFVVHAVTCQIAQVKSCPLYRMPQYDQSGNIKICRDDTDCFSPEYKCTFSPIGQTVCCTHSFITPAYLTALGAPPPPMVFSTALGAAPPPPPIGPGIFPDNYFITASQDPPPNQPQPTKESAPIFERQFQETQPPVQNVTVITPISPPLQPPVTTVPGANVTAATTPTTRAPSSVATAPPALVITAGGFAPSVVQLVVGRLVPTPNPSLFYRAGSVTLICDNGINILVDTGQPVYQATLLQALANRNLGTQGVHIVINTHGHPDHMGNENLFNTAQFVYADYLFKGEEYLQSNITATVPLRLTSNVDVYRTPGHTQDSISVLVKNAATCGTIAITGDLFFTNADAGIWQQYAWDINAQQQSRRQILCLADWIIPGHGILFQVTSDMKAGCNVTAPSGKKMHPIWSGTNIAFKGTFENRITL